MSESEKAHEEKLWKEERLWYKDRGLLPAGLAASKADYRTLLEFCCGPTSKLCDDRYTHNGTRCRRLTEAHDLTTRAGVNFAKDYITTAPRATGMLWGSLPCTSGCPWWEINKKFPNACERMLSHTELFDELFESWIEVADVAFEHGWIIAFEWPRMCSLWKLDKVTDMLERYGLQKCNFDGCALGLVSYRNVPIQKGWSLGVSDYNIFKALEDKRCTCKSNHDWTSGRDARTSGNYTWQLTDLVHKAFEEAVPEPRGVIYTLHTSCPAYCFGADVEEGRCDMPDLVSETDSECEGPDCADYQDIPDDKEFSRMPTQKPDFTHHDHIPYHPQCSAFIHKQMSPAEVKVSPAAQQAVRDEIFKLEKRGTWNIAGVMSWPEVAKRARDAGDTVNVANIFAICSMKNAELAVDDPLRTEKARAVLGGNNIKDQTGKWEVFNEISSSPATSEANRSADTYGMQEGYSTEIADAPQAYLQTKYVGAPLWVRLPKWLQPKSWENIIDPVCPMVLNLYGHPTAGQTWYTHQAGSVEKEGFKRISDGWPSMWFHKALSVLMLVYVDDYKLAGPTQNLPKAWALIKKHIELGPIGTFGRFLGIRYHLQIQGRIRTLVYDMKDFMQSCLTKYEKVCNKPPIYKKVVTPFLDERQIETADWNSAGELAPDACSVLMTIMWGARMCRWDLLRIVQLLASQVTKWSVAADHMLHRVMSYISCTLDLVLCNKVSTPSCDWHLRLYTDADLAGCIQTKKSTSGILAGLATGSLETPPGQLQTWAPLAASSAKQAATVESTPEAELAAAAKGTRATGLPLLDLWECILGRTVALIAFQDNESTVKIIRSGYSPALRTLKRTHGISISRLNEVYHHDDSISMVNCPSENMAADGLTKAVKDSVSWEADIKMMGMQWRSEQELSGKENRRNP